MLNENVNENINKSEYRIRDNHSRQTNEQPSELRKTLVSGSISLAAFLLIGLVIISLAVEHARFYQISNLIFNLLVMFLSYLPIIAIGSVLFFVFRRKYIEVGMFGGYFYRMFGKLRPAPPLATTASFPQGKVTVTEEKNSVPRLKELVTNGMLTQQSPDGMLMFQGWRKDETARYGIWPGTIAITGMQNVGKSVTMMMLILIALYQGARVVICDPHKTKARSLYKKVSALDSMVTFATTEQEILQETQRFSEELQARKQGSNPYPYVIFYDELASLVRAKNPELRKLLPIVIEESSQEGQGYNLNLVLAVHDLSQDGLGDATIRAFINFVYCHRMEGGQSKFIEAFNTRKIRSLIANLPKGHVIARDEVNEIEYLIIPFGDSTDVLTAKKALYNTRQLAPVSETIILPENQSQKTRPLDSYDMEALPMKEVTPILSSDLLTVYNAAKELQEQGISISARAIAEKVGIGKDKANMLLNQLAEQGMLTR